jgi:hypothetical protein
LKILKRHLLVRHEGKIRVGTLIEDRELEREYIDILRVATKGGLFMKDIFFLNRTRKIRFYLTHYLIRIFGLIFRKELPNPDARIKEIIERTYFS